MWRPRSGRFPFVFLVFWLAGVNSRGGGGNVEIRCCLPDFQGVGQTGENLLLVFPGLPNAAISTAPFPRRCSRHRMRGGQGDSILQARSIFAFAAPIFLANSVSLMAVSMRSSDSMLIPGLRYPAAPGSDFSFCQGVE